MIAAGHSEYSKNSACTPMVNELLVRGADWDALDKARPTKKPRKQADSEAYHDLGSLLNIAPFCSAGGALCMQHWAGGVHRQSRRCWMPARAQPTCAPGCEHPVVRRSHKESASPPRHRPHPNSRPVCPGLAQDGTSSLEVATDEQCREAVLARGYSEEGKKVRANPHVVACGLREQYEGGDPVLLDVTLQAEGAQGTAPAPACFGLELQ